VKPVAVVGAGWSGLACAVELAQAGLPVALLDAAPQAGGRARRVDLPLGDRCYPLDNGQHLLIGAYRDTLALMQRVGVAVEPAFVRLPFALRYPDGFVLAAGRAPAPLHLAWALLTARGLTWPERWAMVRWVEHCKRTRWTVTPDRPAIDLLRDTPSRLVQRLWQPLCIAALNAPLEQASAQVFLTVLRDSLGADAASSELLLPRGDLSALLPDAALAFLAARGATVRLRWPVQSLQWQDDGWHLTCRGDTLDAAAVVLALPPERAAPLLAGTGLAALTPATAQLLALDSAPIVTVYLRYEEGRRLAHPVYALRDDPAVEAYGQWVFDRGALDRRCAGVLSVIVSAAGPLGAVAHHDLSRAVAAQLSRELGLPAPVATRVVEDKRATIVPAPGLVRPPARLPVDRLLLAGDAADSAYPSTLEGSVRSGLAAARALLADPAIGA
jgi:squalene-associated FAD-dependent desaturase